MATTYNSTINLYSGVPLVKGGTEVLYLSQGAAEGVLGAFLKATYSNYYFVRDNRRAVQIDAPFGSCDDVNYISFKNASHGGKIFFAFVDQVSYINDNCTQIDFTIDPFPTYLGDATEKDYIYTVRNTPKFQTRSMFYNFTDDYVLPSLKYKYQNLGEDVYTANSQVVYFASAQVSGSGSVAGTGIKMGNLTQALLEDIQQNGGTIIGAYMIPAGWIGHTTSVVRPLGDFSVGNPFVGITSDWSKMKTGVYCKLAVTANSETKYYDVESFADPENVTFGRVQLYFPCPSVFIYPKNYKGMVENLAEGILCKFPSLPISANAVYTNQQRISEIMQSASGAVAGGLAGAKTGGIYGAAVGAIGGALVPALKGAYQEYVGVRFTPPTVIGHGEPITAADYSIHIGFKAIVPDNSAQAQINAYFDYYGYAINAVMQKDRLKLDDKCYLQTGEEFLRGSEADDELNARIMSGIRIRKTLS